MFDALTTYSTPACVQMAQGPVVCPPDGKPPNVFCIGPWVCSVGAAVVNVSRKDFDAFVDEVQLMMEVEQRDRTKRRPTHRRTKEAGEP